MKKKVKKNLIKSREIAESFDNAFLDVKEANIDSDNNIIGDVFSIGP